MKHLKFNLLQIERMVTMIAILVAIFSLYKDYVMLIDAASIEGDVDVYAPNSFKTIVALLGLIVVFLSTFLKHPLGLLISLCSIACPIYIFIEWYVDSFRIFRNENAGWEAKVNKMGLAGAEWEHVVMLCITTCLFTSLTFRTVRRFHGTGNS